MTEIILSDYFYDDETTTQFIFFKIPRQLTTDPRFKRISHAVTIKPSAEWLSWSSMI